MAEVDAAFYESCGLTRLNYLGTADVHRSCHPLYDPVPITTGDLEGDCSWTFAGGGWGYCACFPK